MTALPPANSIQVVAYFGDTDTFAELHLIGPYPTDADRNQALLRLECLPGNRGDAEFWPSDVDPAAADHHCTPEQVAAVKHFNQVVGALYGYEVDDNGQDVRHPPPDVTPAPSRQRRVRQAAGQAALFDTADQ